MAQRNRICLDFQIRNHFLLREFLTTAEADTGTFTKRINTSLKKEHRTLPSSFPAEAPDSILGKHLSSEDPKAASLPGARQLTSPLTLG